MNDEHKLILLSKLEPLTVEESGRQRTVSVADQKLFMIAASTLNQIYSNHPSLSLTKRQFAELTQISERSITRISTALRAAGLIDIQKSGWKFRFVVLTNALKRKQVTGNE